MKDKIKDFVATYKPPAQPKPYFGFFKDLKYTPKFKPTKNKQDK